MRRYDEQVQVRRGMVAGVEGPHQILWRDRLYVVREVLGHWFEVGPWWRSVAARRLQGTDTDSPTLQAHSHTGTRTGADAGAFTHTYSGARDDGDREVWRVEAAAGRQGRPAVLDIALDSTDGSWRLVHAHD